jgi:type VI secretion system protein ImpF
MAVDAKHITPSLLDRLTDEEPDAARDAPKAYSKKLRDHKNSVMRDLSGLLNSRLAELVDPDFPSCAASLLGYGLLDISSRTAQSPSDRERIGRDLQATIERYEPRLRNVQVSAVQSHDGGAQLHFSVRALLQVDPEPEPIYFDTVLDREKAAVAVSLES